MKKFLFVLITLSFIAVSSVAQSLPYSVLRATQEGDAVGLAESFNSNIELILPTKNGVFSKSQAEYVMADFFKEYPSASFTVIHQGKRESASFTIGKYTSANGVFRFTFLSKSSGGAALIHQLRIEKENE